METTRAELAYKVVQSIVSRGGFDGVWDSIGKDIRAEIYMEVVLILEKHMPAKKEYET